MIFKRLISCRFTKRINRFVALVEFEGQKVSVHLANPGRMKELLLPGVQCLIRFSVNPNRKLAYDLCLVRHNRVWVSLQSSLANDLVDEAIAMKKISALSEYTVKKREIQMGRSRPDFLLAHHLDPEKDMIMEVKSCTLVRNRHGFFPDAPTIRGARHVRELTERAQSGKKAAVLFCVQRSDCDVVSPNRETDPDFAEALQAAAKAGVEIFAVRCSVGTKRIAVTGEIRIGL